MPISDKYKCIFVHIPKTAGTSIEKSLGIGTIDHESLRSHQQIEIGEVTYAPQHFTASILRTHPRCQEHWDKYFKFAIVRHPYTRVLSEFCWSTRKSPKPFTLKRFRNYLHDYYATLDLDHKLGQVEYLYEDGKLLIDYVGKFEELDKVFKFLKQKIGITRNLPHVHKSSRVKDSFSLLTPNDKNFIYELYKEDFEKFNYEK